MPRRKLTDEQVTEIQNRVAAGESLRSIAKDYGVFYTTVRNVAQRGYRGYRNQWGHYGSGKFGRNPEVAAATP